MADRKTETKAKRPESARSESPAPNAVCDGPGLAPSVQQVLIDELVPYARNSRTHSEHQIAQIAGSIREFGFTNPVLIDGNRGIIAGHGRVMAARMLGMSTVPAILIDYMTDAQKRAYVIADNKLAANAGWDEELLALELGDLQSEGFDLTLTGFDDDELAGLMLKDDEEAEPPEDEAPSVQTEAVSVPGDVWLLGEHRVMCGSSLAITDVEKLLAGRTAQLLHADPPYGMGKEGDGVANDNLYGEDLDRFQLSWWATWRPFLTDSASVYVWGNAPDLWRLWYVGGLGGSERLELCNEIVWDKGVVPGMASAAVTQYQPATERCLFFKLGAQYVGNVNTEDFPISWEAIRAYLAGQAQAAGVTVDAVRQVCGVDMYSHWFSRSQFTLLPAKHYKALAKAYPGHFERPWADLKSEWDRVKGDPTRAIQAVRSYFDNAHDAMTDVWAYPRVVGAERHGHATPKPVMMMARILKSSLPAGGLVLEPFGGSGSTLMGAEATGRICCTMELQPCYVDVIVRRWQQHTGRQAVLEASGQTFDDLAAERVAVDASG